jgi:hypothetical protein
VHRPDKIAHTKKTSKQRGNAFPASKSIHIRTNFSPLSVHAKQQNYRGFFNLGVIILLVSHFRVIVDNIFEYGLLWSYFTESATPTAHSLDLPRPIEVGISWAAYILMTFAVEKLAQNGVLSDRATFTLQGIISSGNVIGACLWVWYSKSQAGLCMLYLLQSVILWMKLVSYAHCNR